MFNFGVKYSLDSLTKDTDLVVEHVEKEKVVLMGEGEYSSFAAIYIYLKTIEGTDWYQLMHYQKTRLQGSSH